MTAEDTRQNLKPGAELANRYALIRELGRGGEAATWLAEDRVTRSRVALKVLVSSVGNRGRLRDEWQTSIRLLHPHIVRVFEFHDEASGAFYSLQHLEGPDVSLLAGKGAAAVLPVVAALADALRYAHGKGVVHRDVKATNVLLDRNGAPYLIDFGVAASAGAPASGGSIAAASPESLKGEAATPADDIFALGGLAYELLSGRSPHGSGDLEQAIAELVPQPLTAEEVPDLPPAVSQLVAAMLAKDAAERPDAGEVLESLSAAGFPPGVVPRELRGSGAQDSSEVIEVRERRAPRKSGFRTPETPAGTGGGVTQRSVLLGLAVLVTLLLFVVFYLPGKLTTAPTDGADPVAEEAEPETAPEPAAEAPAPGLPGRDERVEARQATEAVLGRLLSHMETLEARAVERWGGLRYSQARAAYESGDEAYLARDYARATEEYGRAIELVEPLLEEVDQVFSDTLEAAEDALANADSVEALRNFDLAVAISPGSRRAEEGRERARNLDAVLALMESGLRYEDELDLPAARESFKQAMELDPAWQPAREGFERVQGTALQMDFDSRMSEGIAALADNDYPAARAAFRMAQQLRPGSTEPADGLLQVDQGIRLATISRLEREVLELQNEERWEDAVAHYEQILELDDNLEFAKTGLNDARGMVGLHRQLDEYIAEPDSLSAPSTMQRATNLVLTVTRMSDAGPRLNGQKDELSRLLKRAATPLDVEFVSDNLTEVSVFRVGRLGRFSSQQLKLRPGNYVAVGNRAGYRDVRIEFRVAPELEMQPIVVRCEEPI